MAFVLSGFKKIEEFGIFRNTKWAYDAGPTDNAAAMNTSGFFNAALPLGVQIGDEIIATQWTTALPTHQPIPGTSAITSRTRFMVLSVSAAGVIDVTDGDAVTMTNTD